MYFSEWTCLFNSQWICNLQTLKKSIYYIFETESIRTLLSNGIENI